MAILRTNLDIFYAAVELVASGQPIDDEDAMQYYKAALQASNDRSSRILRGNIISQLIRQQEG